MLASLLLFTIGSAQSLPLPTFMTGCWKVAKGERWTQECWMEPTAGIMLGASREGTGDRLRSWEHLRIEHSASGEVIYLASPEGRPPVTFKAKSTSASAVEFVNAAHDYPQRIRYELNGDKLDAEISLIDGSKPVRWTYLRENR